MVGEQIGFLAIAARPSGYGVHNSKKVFRLFPRRNIVFLCCAVKIKKRKENIAVQMVTGKFISMSEYFCGPSSRPMRQIEKHNRATIVKFIILKNSRFYGL